MRVLVTGASGFVGRYLVDALRLRGDDVVACGGPGQNGEFFPLDLGDAASIRAALDAAKPAVVFHLAAQTFVPESLGSPIATYETNTLGTARLAQALRDYAKTGEPVPRLVFTSSAEVYGAREPGDLPIREGLDLRPANPYAASKAGAEAILLAEARSFGLDVVIARAFNHIGPGQSERFVVASLAAQLARIAKGGESLLMVGNLTAARDFLDVRDVVEAYVALAREGASGQVYNVCSGTAVTIRDMLGQLIVIARVPVEVREDPARMRPVDVPLLVGSSEKLTRATQWSPRILLRRSLQDIYAAALESAIVQ
jgi:GDP-4-dehydro-6-deoxy-D-mannose reductase